MNKTRYAVCGLSTRGIEQYVLPLLGKSTAGSPDFSDRAELVGVVDPDAIRVRTFCEKLGVRLPHYAVTDLPRMLAEQHPDTLLVVGPDGTHCQQIVAGLKGGCDVIAEKPMVISSQEARQVRAAERETGRRVRVAFNFRYAPASLQMKRMILQGKVGAITSVEFTYNCDTWHGSSYFYRWNSRRAMSGGLNISKGVHHFDLINWLLADVPEEVFAFGALNYYGKNGALRPRDTQGRPLDPVREKLRCPIFQKWYAGKVPPESNDIRTGWDRFDLPYGTLYPPAERRYIYDDAIDVEDTYSAVVRYRRGASMSYSCNFCSPWEGYILAINGTAGRLEIVHHADPASGKREPPSGGQITFFPLFGGKEVTTIPPVTGGHGGADAAIQRDLFVTPSEETQSLALIAGSEAGALAVAVGEAVARSIQEHRSIRIDALLQEQGKLG